MPDVATRRAIFPPTYRLVVYCVMVGAIGAAAALGFDFAVEFVQKYLLVGIGGYRPPQVGMLAPVVDLPAWSQRWWIPVATTLGGLLSGWLVFRFAPEAEGHGTDAAISSYHRGGQVPLRVPVVKAISSALGPMTLRTQGTIQRLAAKFFA